MRIDLHTHSTVSDGTDPPAVVVRRAAAEGLSAVALTDHDTLAGLPRADAEAQRQGVMLVPGVEMSTRLRGASVHLLAFFPDPFYGPLADELARVREARQDRTAAIVARLNAAGVDLTVEEVERAAGSATSIGRPHVADALVARGVVGHRDEAFALWLADGLPGAVSKYEPGTATAVALVRAAGGVPVLAHPWGRPTRSVVTAESLTGLVEAGIVGLEVDHEDHSEDDRRRLRRIAADLDLLVTGASDHHGTGKRGYPLGCNLTDPEQFERLLATAKAIAAAAGRGGPDPSS